MFQELFPDQNAGLLQFQPLCSRFLKICRERHCTPTSATSLQISIPQAPASKFQLRGCTMISVSGKQTSVSKIGARSARPSPGFGVAAEESQQTLDLP